MLVDKRAHFVRSASSSAAKNTDAAFRISFARRSSYTSRRSFLISSRSAAVGRSGRDPFSASACLTRFLSTSELTPRSLATCAIGRPDSNTSRTPRSSNSSGYLRGLAIDAEHPFRPGHHPGPSRSPRKSGRLTWARPAEKHACGASIQPQTRRHAVPVDLAGQLLMEAHALVSPCRHLTNRHTRLGEKRTVGLARSLRDRGSTMSGGRWDAIGESLLRRLTREPARAARISLRV